MRPLEVTEAFYESLLGRSVHLPDALLLCAVEERVTPRERSRIEAHLAGCGRCRADFQALQHFAERQPSAPAPSLIIAALPEQAPSLSATPELILIEDPEPLPMSPPTLRFAEAPAVSTPKPAAVPRSRGPAPVPWVPLVFLALNALGLGAVYRAFSAQRTPAKVAPSAPSVALPATQGAPGAELARFQAAYERQLAQERGKLAQLEKQLQTLRLAPSPAPLRSKPVAPVATATPKAKLALGVKTKTPALLRATSLPLAALSVHPELTWKPVPKASRYSAELTDSTGKSVSKSELRLPTWRVAAALQRGETYRWSVTPLDRESKPLGEAQTGELTITTEEVATRISDQLKALATELEGVGLATDARMLMERAELLLKK